MYSKLFKLVYVLFVIILRMRILSFPFISDLRHVCQQCGRNYKRRCHLYSHLRYECGKEALFRCDFCGKPFHQKSNWKAHVLRHKVKSNAVS